MESFDLYPVGGFVRDLMLGQDPGDLDVTCVPVSCGEHAGESFDRLIWEVRQAGYRIFESNREYFTLRTTFEGEEATRPRLMRGHKQVDFVMARKDGPSSDGRHPDYVLSGTLEDDLSRRDFTINAMALHVDRPRQIVDPFGGAKDLEKRILRFVGDPMQRVREDFLRVVRLIRFSATLNFRIGFSATTTLSHLETAEGVGELPVERIFTELVKATRAGRASEVRLMRLLYAEIPESLRNAILRDNLHFAPSLKQRG